MPGPVLDPSTCPEQTGSAGRAAWRGHLSPGGHFPSERRSRWLRATAPPGGKQSFCRPLSTRFTSLGRYMGHFPALSSTFQKEKCVSSEVAALIPVQSVRFLSNHLEGVRGGRDGDPPLSLGRLCHEGGTHPHALAAPSSAPGLRLSNSRRSLVGTTYRSHTALRDSGAFCGAQCESSLLSRSHKTLFVNC